MSTTTIQLRRDTAANWTGVNPTLASGEPGIETDTRKWKVGNGSDNWSTLNYMLGAGGGGGLTVTVAQVSGSDFTSSSNSLVDITGLTFAAAAHSLYEIDILLSLSQNDVHGVKYAVAFSASGATGEFSNLGNFDQDSGNNGIDFMSLGNANTFAQAVTQNVDQVAFIKGFVKTGANAGNITSQILVDTSGTVTVYQGSRMSVTTLK